MLLPPLTELLLKLKNLVPLPVDRDGYLVLLHGFVYDHGRICCELGSHPGLLNFCDSLAEQVANGVCHVNGVGDIKPAAG